MSGTPSLPYVVLKCHKPLLTSEILAQGHVPLDIAHQANHTGALGSTVGSPTDPQTHIRTIHPKIHYIFDNDPLEAEILEKVPKSRCITLDLDPKSGVVTNVESFLTGLQVMDVKLVSSSSAALSTSTPSSAVFPPSAIAIEEATDAKGTAKGTTKASPPSSFELGSKDLVRAKVTASTSSIDKAGLGKSDEGVGTSSPGKNWTLMIDAVEVDDRNHERYEHGSIS